MIDLRYPNITGANANEQMAQMRNYLHQLVDQLQFAMNTIESNKSTSSVVISAPRGAGNAEAPKSPTLDGEVAFNALKPFIIKSAEIVEAYYEEINSKLSSEYVAQSEFGTFTEKNEQAISQTSTEITQILSNIQQITTDITNVNFKLAEASGYIVTGIIDEDADGLPVYGVEINQTNKKDGEVSYSKFARFTSDRLSFYDSNGYEAAYISDKQLVIPKAEIKSTYKIGSFEDSILPNGDVVTKIVPKVAREE